MIIYEMKEIISNYNITIVYEAMIITKQKHRHSFGTLSRSMFLPVYSSLQYMHGQVALASGFLSI